MSEWQGIYYDGRTTQRRDATLAVAGSNLEVAVGGETFLVPLTEIAFHAPVGGKGLWRIDLPDGARCETETPPPSGLARDWVAPMERRWPVAVAALALTALVSWGLMVWGIPLLADRAAHLLPPKIEQEIGAQSLEVVEQILPPTALPSQRQTHLQNLLDRVATSLDIPPMRLVCRGGGKLGANALALPSGIVVMTDDLNTLANNDNELMAVLAHEAGHVQGRHTLRSILQNSATALFLASLTGDWNSLAALGAALPTALFDAHYSRQFEREADGVALTFLNRENIAPSTFADILERIDKTAHLNGDQTAPFLSSHPPTLERLQAFRANGAKH